MHCFCWFVPSFHLAYLLSQSDLFGQGCADIAIYCAETQCFQSVGQPQKHPFFRSFLHGLMPSFEKYFLWDYSGLVHRFAHFFISTPCHVSAGKPRLPLFLCVSCSRCLLLFLQKRRLHLLLCGFVSKARCFFRSPFLFFRFLLVHLFVFASFLLQMFSSSLVQLALVPSQTSWHVKPHVQPSEPETAFTKMSTVHSVRIQSRDKCDSSTIHMLFERPTPRQQVFRTTAFP